MRKFAKSLLLSGVAGACLLAAADIAAAADATGTQVAAADTSASDKDNAETVTVTATRRAEAQKNVPLPITTVSPKEIKLEKIRNIGDVLLRVPGTRLSVGKGASTTSLEIRGQASSAQSPGLDGPIAFFQDDLYYGSPASFDTDFYDIAQIAVLKGPQGTTFGRNVVGGAMQVTSNTPEQGINSGNITATLENYNGIETTGYINRALSDTLAMRFAFSYRNRDGYSLNTFNGHRIDDLNKIGGRFQLAWAPNSNFDATLLLSYQNTDQSGTATKFIGPGFIAADTAARTNNDPRKVYLDDDGSLTRKVIVGALHLNYRTDSGTIQSITGVHSLTQDFQEDVDAYGISRYTPANNHNNEVEASQEFRFVSPDEGRFSYVAGVFGDVNTNKLLFDMDFNTTANSQAHPESFFNTLLASALGDGLMPNGSHVPVFSQVFQDNTTKTLAAYFEGTFHLTDTLDIIAGARYTITQKNGSMEHIGPNAFYGKVPYEANYDRTWYQLTPRAILRWRPNDDLMLYVSASNGVKSGGFDYTFATKAQFLVGLNPENSWSYEAGIKGTFFNKTLYLDLSVYDAITKNLQVRVLQGGLFVERNAGSLEARGAEVQLDLRPIEGLDFGVRYAYTDAFFADFKGCTAAGLDCTGNPAPGTPKNDVVIFGSYQWDLSNAMGSLELRGSTHYASAYNSGVTGPLETAISRPLTEIPWTVDASIVYTAPNSNWSIQLWGKNLTDELYLASGSNYYFYALSKAEFATGLREVDRVMFGPPRTYGITISYDF